MPVAEALVEVTAPSSARSVEVEMVAIPVPLATTGFWSVHGVVEAIPPLPPEHVPLVPVTVPVADTVTLVRQFGDGL